MLVFHRFSSSEHADYRFGFNGMEKDDEVHNVAGSSMTTYFRQYDARLGRWMSPEPKPVAWESLYASFRNNPVYYADPNGDWVKGAGFFRNLFNSDAKIEAQDFAKEVCGQAFKDGKDWKVLYTDEGLTYEFTNQLPAPSIAVFEGKNSSKFKEAFNVGVKLEGVHGASEEPIRPRDESTVDRIWRISIQVLFILGDKLGRSNPITKPHPEGAPDMTRQSPQQPTQIDGTVTYTETTTLKSVSDKQVMESNERVQKKTMMIYYHSSPLSGGAIEVLDTDANRRKLNGRGTLENPIPYDFEKQLPDQFE